MVLGGNLVKGETLVKRKLILLLKERWYLCLKSQIKGMGKYFVTLAKQVGYERTILLLGRHLRFSMF